MLKKNIMEYKDFGCILFKIDNIMQERDITVYELSMKSNIPFSTVKKLKEGISITRINVDTIAKLCYLLDCEVQDLMEYVKPKEG